MKLCRFLLRYYPPGIVLEYELSDKSKRTKEIDILELNGFTDVDELASQIIEKELLISHGKKTQLRSILTKLQEKTNVGEEYHDFYLFKVLRAHMLPLTNCAVSSLCA